jgi:hypothetical protein
MTTPTNPVARAAWFAERDVRLSDFLAVIAATTVLADYPHADRVESGVLIYDSSRLRDASRTLAGRMDVMAELASALMDGPGLVVFSGAFP